MPFSLGGRHAPRVSLPVYNPDDSDSDMHSASDVEGTSQSDDEYASDYDSSRHLSLLRSFVWLIHGSFTPLRTRNKDQKGGTSG